MAGKMFKKREKLSKRGSIETNTIFEGGSTAATLNWYAGEAN
jgi:hypothetical protein